MRFIKCKQEDYELQRKRVINLADKWIKPLGLGYWNIEFDGHDSSRKSRNHDGSLTVFDCHVMPEYLSVTIEFFAPTLINISDEQLEIYFLHELMHIFMAEIQHECDDLNWHVEQICTRLAKGISWAVEFVNKANSKEIA